MENQPQGGAPMPPSQTAPQGGNDQTMKIVGLIVNLFVPGVGTLIMKDKKAGVPQLVMTIVGYICIWVLWWTIVAPLIGGLLAFAAWIWALVVSIKWFKS